MSDQSPNEVQNSKIKAKINVDSPKNFSENLDLAKERSAHLNRKSENGIINEVSGASILARDDGQISLTANQYAGYKINPAGMAVERSFTSTTITNRKELSIDEITINNHKLNNKLYEYTNFKQILGKQDSAAGNFCITGTMLVKSWEPHLQRYVFIRRQVRMPMFSNLLPVPSIAKGLNIADPLEQIADLQVSMDSGYQVVGKIEQGQQHITEQTSANSALANGIVESAAKKVADQTKLIFQQE